MRRETNGRKKKAGERTIYYNLATVLQYIAHET